MKPKKVVIVTPLLNEEINIKPFISEVREVLSQNKQYALSFLFIDDGSSDRSWSILTEMAAKSKQVSALKLSRNFGSHTAWYAGLTTLFNDNLFDLAVLMTIDLQDPPSLIPLLLNKLQNGIRVAWAVRQGREDGFINNLVSRFYYQLVRRFALSTMPVGGMDFCVIDKKVVEQVVKSAEKNTSLLAFILWLGFPQVFLPYKRRPRRFGKSQWTLTKKIKLLIDTFVAFSYAPIRLTSYLGFLVSGIGFIYALIILVRRLILGAPIEGWSSLMLVILLLSGTQLIMLGIVAEYLWRTLDESRKRPLYIVDQKLNI